MRPIALARTAAEAPGSAQYPDGNDLTRLLLDWSLGDDRALDRLTPLVYGDPRRLAQSHLASESPGHTLQATALVHELYVRLVKQKRMRWQNRGQFLAVAATMMRRILREPRAREAGSEARRRRRRALSALAEFAPRPSRIVELRFFGGLTIEETAEVLGVSPATVKLDWSVAKAWLFRELGGQ